MDFQQVQAGKLTFMVNQQANRVRWQSEGLPMAAPEQADFWRVHLDDGYHRSMTVRSYRQKGVVRQTADGLELHYDRLTGEDGKTFEIGLTIHIEPGQQSGYPLLTMWAEIDNRSDARLNELQLPFVELATAGDTDRSRDTLYKMNGLGQRMDNPWQALEASHTEYMAADYHEIWDGVQYPSLASMCWFGLQTGGHFLYIAKHDDQQRTVTLTAGRNPRGADPRLILTISHYPLAEKGEQLTLPPVVVSLNQGDWRTGSDIYGGWARSSWYTVPKKPDWVQNMTGWQRIIMRHQYGEAFFRYHDLPRLYREGMASGLDTLMVFGWWRGRFDNGYPVYEPDDALGGAAALTTAIREVQSLGGHVILYTNGILIDVATDYYEEVGYRIAQKDLDHNEYRDHYQFSNDGMLLRSFGYKSFVTACPSTPEWTERVVLNGKLKLSLGADSIFFDQMAGHRPNLCFDQSHPHGKRGDQDGEARIGNMKAILALLDENQAFGSEFTVDAFAPYVHAHHGCQLGNFFSEDAVPQLFRRTFPEPIMTNRFIHDEKDGYRRILNHAFFYGLRFDVSINRGRVCGIAGAPEYAKRIGELVALRAKYKEFFYTGSFVCDHTPPLPQGVRMSEYRSGDGRYLAALWNDSDQKQSFTLCGKSITLEPQAVDCCLWTD